MTWRQIGKLTVPLLLVQGTADEVVFPHEANRLVEVARAAGNDDVELLSVDGGTHFFNGCETTVTRAVSRWLDRIA